MRRFLPTAVLVPILGLAAVVCSQPVDQRPGGQTVEKITHKPEPYQRVEAEGKDRVALQMAVREFEPPRAGMPRVYLAGAVHIARPEFYQGLQEFLDAQDVVLFEGVKPPGSGNPALDLEHEKTDEQKAKATQRRVRLVAMAAERFKQEHDRYPESLDDLQKGSERRIAELLKVGVLDAWGNPLIFEVREGGDFDVYSLGSDAQPGGEGPAQDVRYSDTRPISKSEAGDRSEGIQQKLASALGVVFQLEAMDHNKPNWRNSDLAVDQIQARMEAVGADADGLLSMLSGSSLGGRLIGIFLDMLATRPEDQAKMRIMMIEMLSMADQLMDAAPGGMGAMMAVILDDRNEVVLADLRELIDSDEPPETIAVIYGAGHLPGIEKGLVEDMGYRPVADTWHTAMEADAESAGFSPAQFTQFRAMVSKMMQRQLDAAARKKQKSTKEN